MARPTALTPDVEQRICKALQAGNTRATAARFGGVCESTFYNWIARGEDARNSGSVAPEDEPFVEFLEAVQGAETICEVNMTAQLMKAASGHDTERTTQKTVTKVIGTRKVADPDTGELIPSPIMATETTTTTVTERRFDPRIALEWLQRRRPADWAKTSRHEVTGKDGGALEIVGLNFAAPSADEITAAEAREREAENMARSGRTGATGAGTAGAGTAGAAAKKAA